MLIEFECSLQKVAETHGASPPNSPAIPYSDVARGRCEVNSNYETSPIFDQTNQLLLESVGMGSLKAKASPLDNGAWG
jgi:hypothetical protein